jgi:hypothetical protein
MRCCACWSDPFRQATSTIPDSGRCRDDSGGGTSGPGALGDQLAACRSSRPGTGDRTDLIFCPPTDRCTQSRSIQTARADRPGPNPARTAGGTRPAGSSSPRCGSSCVGSAPGVDGSRCDFRPRVRRCGGRSPHGTHSRALSVPTASDRSGWIHSDRAMPDPPTTAKVAAGSCSARRGVC